MRHGMNPVKIFICLLISLCIPLSTFAIPHTLTGIDVQQDVKGKYNIILKLGSNAKVKKVISNQDTLTLVLNSALPSDKIDIIYDNTSNINNVIVQKKNADSTKIVFEGKNISNAEIYTKNISTGFVTPIDSNTIFFGVNKKLFSLSVIIMFAWMFVHFLQLWRKKRISLKSRTLKQNRKLRRNSTVTPAKKIQYVSAPNDFIINEYMAEEKIRKAG